MLLSGVSDGGGREVSPRGSLRVARFVFGLVLFVVAVGFLAWNEQAVVRALRECSRITRSVTEVAVVGIDPAQDGRLVHLSGDLVAREPLRDPAMGLSRTGLVRLRRTVEMYQWRETRQSSTNDVARATFSYAKKWSEAPIESRRFRSSARHENPAMPVRTALFAADDAVVGDRVLVPSLLARFDAFEPVTPPLRPPAGFVRTADGFFRGVSAEAPEIGDIRITFAGVPAQPVSVVAEQRGARLVPASLPDGETVAQLAPGLVGAADLVAQRQERPVWSWVLRGIGLGLLVAAMALLLPMFLHAGGRTHVLAVCLAAAVAMVTIGIAWLTFRPWLGVLLIGGGALVATLDARLRPARLAPPPSAIPAE